MLDRFRIRLSGLGPVAIRLALGAVFITHGWPKISGLAAGQNPLARVVGNWPAPMVWGWLAGLTEFAGGICILLGLLTRFWSAGMVILMGVAIVTRHPPIANGTLQPFGSYEYQLTLLLASLGLFLTGPGPISVDYLFGRLIRGQRANPVVGGVCLPPPAEHPVEDRDRDMATPV